jgi:hypothetical protein
VDEIKENEMDGHIARTGQMRNARNEDSTLKTWRIWEDNIKILRWILRKEGVEVGAGFSWLRIGTSEHDNEPSGSIKVGRGEIVLDWLSVS